MTDEAVRRLRESLTVNDIHLLGKLLIAADDDHMTDNGFKEAERTNADALLARLDPLLSAVFGDTWDEQEAL